MAAASLNPNSRVHFSRTDPKIGTTVEVDYVWGFSAQDQAKLKMAQTGTVTISNGDFRVVHKDCMFCVNLQKIESVADNILQLPQTLIRELEPPIDMKKREDLSDRVIFIALRSEDPLLRMKGAEWVREEKIRWATGVYHRGLKDICKYFEQKRKWEQEPRSFSQEEIDCFKGEKEVSREQAKHFLFRSLWFEEHPFHQQSVKGLREAMQNKFRSSEEGKLTYSLSFWSVATPVCIRDIFDGLPESEYSLYRGMTEQEAIGFVQKNYQKSLAEQVELDSEALLAQAGKWAEETRAWAAEVAAEQKQ